MRIPGNKDERRRFYMELVQQCRVSMSRRKEQYETRQRLFLYGSDQETSRANRTESHIETLAAILYSGDSARFNIDLPTGASQEVIKRTPAVNKRLNELFQDERIDVLFGLAVVWALVYNSTFIKFVPRKNGFSSYMVEPHGFGVLREDIPSLDDQEAFIHEYFISRTKLSEQLAGNPKREAILAAIPTESKKQPDTDAGPIRAIATSVAYAGNITGYLNSAALPDDYMPEVGVDLIRMTDLWVRDEEQHDYHTTIFAGDSYQTIYDGGNLFLPQDHPFSQVCPNPLYGYFWGESEVARLRPLQEWRNERAEQIRQLLNLAVDPPAVFSGFPMVDEKKFGMKMPGSILTSQLPSAKTEVLRPQIPQDIFYEVSQIDAMFDDVSGITDLYQGRGGGTKTRGHAEAVGQFGSLRPRRKALIVENCLDAVATKMMKCAAAYITDKVTTDDGDSFMLSEYPADVVVKSDGHSQSPVFAAATQEIALKLFESKAIDRESLITLLNPPGVEELLQRLKDIEKQEAQAHAEDVELQREKILHGRH